MYVMICPYTPKIREIAFEGRLLRLCNQKSDDWTHPYEYRNNGGNLSDSGCGVFSLVHCLEWMHGIRLDPDAVADVSVSVGGRGDDGTDRPAMLQGMTDCGFARENGFRYDGAGLLNDRERLWEHMSVPGNTALCNLRVGHIVALLKAREVDGLRELLVMDSVAESAKDAVREHVRAVVPGSEIVYPVRNRNGLVTGAGISHALFWVDADLPRDFTLIIRTDLPEAR